MPQVYKQFRAEQDLLEIWLHSFHQWGEEHADSYLDALETAINLLAAQPLMCRERIEFTPPVRIHHHARHLVVYQALDNGINVIRVLHESMEIEVQLD